MMEDNYSRIFPLIVRNTLFNLAAQPFHVRISVYPDNFESIHWIPFFTSFATSAIAVLVVEKYSRKYRIGELQVFLISVLSSQLSTSLCYIATEILKDGIN